MKELTTKELIIKTAFEILAKDGVDKLTSTRLIERAGISKGGLYHHFKDMDEVYLAILDMLMETLSEGFFELEFESIDHLNDVMVEAIFDEISQYKDVYVTLFYFLSKSTTRPKVKESLKKITEDSLAKWANLYESFSTEPIEAQKLDKCIRMIDMYFAGLIIHEMLIDQLDYYKKITKEFMKVMTSYVGLANQQPT